MSAGRLRQPRFDLNRVNTHILPVDFTYIKPGNLREALEYLAKYGGEAKPVAGGTDLLVKIKQRVVEPKYLIDVSDLTELRYIEDRGEYIAIGSSTKLRDLELNATVRKYFRALYEALKSMGGVQIRNMGTLGGNLCNASPAADTAPPLMVFNAELVLQSLEGDRVVPINKFFLGPGKTVLCEDEILREIRIPYPGRSAGSSFIKVSRVAADLAKVNVATYVEVEGEVVEEVRIALGAVAPTPIRVLAAEELLKGKKLTPEVLREIAEEVRKAVKPITDVRSTAEYRRYVSGVITVDSLRISYDRALGGGKFG